MTVELPDLRRRPATDLRSLKPDRAKALAEALGIETVLDVVTTYPIRPIDRSKQATIADLKIGDAATILVEVRSSRVVPGRGRPRAEIVVGDRTGKLKLTFFNQPWRVKQLREGRTGVMIFGKVELFRGVKQMTNPVVDLIGDQTGQVIPLYPQSDKYGVTTAEVRELVQETLRRAQGFADPLPHDWRDRLDVQDRTWAFEQIHAPDTTGAWYAARNRLAFDELLRLQVILVERKRYVERTQLGYQHQTDGELVERFISSLPYQLTNAQQRAIEEIKKDLRAQHPMHRLLQGDVGSGKTFVAVATLLTSVQGGHQGALLAPTEVLAEQHAATIKAALDGLMVPSEADLFGERPLRVELLTGRTPAAERNILEPKLKNGEIDILIGTHALLTDRVVFADLGAVVIDEQHRFGVEQRAVLKEQGDRIPDVLVMTATPIPRTAAMTVYGDLDVTTLDELPPGRTPITTIWAHDETQAWDRIREELGKGRQAYVVCPLVEESEKIQARSATQEFERLRETELKDHRVGLLHGQLPAGEKDAVMNGFRANETQVLVATTVIEVGVDVPNATVMVILDPDRFGIAQLHQLRGRVGRGSDRSWCYLIGEAQTEDGQARLNAFESTTDGFILAEVDLDIRGEGTVLGVRQKGRNDLKLASLRNDRALVEKAREVAFDLVDRGLGEIMSREVRDLVDDDEADYLFKG